LADELDKLDRESLLKMAQSPRVEAKGRWMGRVCLIMAIIGLFWCFLGSFGRDVVSFANPGIKNSSEVQSTNVGWIASGLFMCVPWCLYFVAFEFRRTCRRLDAIVELLKREPYGEITGYGVTQNGPHGAEVMKLLYGALLGKTKTNHDQRNEAERVGRFSLTV